MRKNALDHDAPARVWLLAAVRNIAYSPMFWLGLFAITLACGVVFYGRLPGDAEASRSFQGLGWTWLEPVMRFGDTAGSKIWLASLLSALVVFLVVFRRWKETAVLALATGFYGFSPLLKETIQRPRPNLEGINVLVNPVGYSFPSGHAMGSGLIIGGAVVVALLIFRGNRPIQAIAAAIGMTMLLVIGASRVYLGAHWTSDVIAGYLIAATFLLIALKITRRQPKTAEVGETA